MGRDRGSRGQADNQSPQNAAGTPRESSVHQAQSDGAHPHQGTEDGAQCRLLLALQHVCSQLLTALPTPTAPSLSYQQDTHSADNFLKL